MKFECVRCGWCCRQAGALRLTKRDVETISAYLSYTFDEFCEVYNVSNIQDTLYFIEIDNCPFLEETNECAINDVKPFFCANYIPYVDSHNAAIYQNCKGIGAGKDWSEEEIKERYNNMIRELVIVKEEVSADGNDIICD